ncbi:MAG TPA: redoxin family protein, partial [Methylomirabilota bacterium]|nr:redoxin family protein [Methylomirabilota bacterium]
VGRLRERLHVATLGAGLVLGWANLLSGADLALGAPAKPGAIAVRDLSGALVRPLADQGQKLTVLFFVMHECPVANSYAPEISRIIASYADKGVRGYVVYVESDLPVEKARQHARDFGYKTGVLLDPEHQLVRAAGARVSPEAAVLSPAGQVLYRGRIDDRVADFGKRRVEPTRRDLRLALDAILDGQPLPARLTRAVGCYIPDVDPPQSERKPDAR